MTMILKQYYLGCLAHASYLVADADSGAAAVVDPQRDVDQYLEDARAQGLTISHVLLTHFHADFVAGHLELRDRCGATIHLGARARADYRFEPLSEGDTIELGSVRLKILETPGHTPEGISILVHDLSRDASTPHAVLTGDTLFIGDVGRPDLMASAGVTAPELAGMLYDSLRTRLMTLPDETLVYPAHGAGSMCGKNLSTDTVSTIGSQKKYNYALQPMSRDDFIGMVTADQPEAPRYFAVDAILNRQERATLTTSLGAALTPLTLDETLARREGGAQLLDVRDPADFAGAHLAGSVNIGLGGKFATWAGSLLDAGAGIVLIAEPGRQEEAATRLGRVGFDNVIGYLDKGMAALDGRPDLTARTLRVTAQALAEQLASPSAPLVLDVRGEKEWSDKRIAGSLNIPLPHLEQRLGELPRGRKLAIHCATGYRSAIAASLLARHGVVDVEDLVGGIAAWSSAALPVV